MPKIFCLFSKQNTNKKILCKDIFKNQSFVLELPQSQKPKHLIWFYENVCEFKKKIILENVHSSIFAHIHIEKLKFILWFINKLYTFFYIQTIISCKLNVCLFVLELVSFTLIEGWDLKSCVNHIFSLSNQICLLSTKKKRRQILDKISLTHYLTLAF